MALVYIDRVGKVSPVDGLCELSAHRLLITAAMLAAKSHDDKYYSNRIYAKVGGIQTKEANQLEVRMLKLLGWNTHVSPEEFRQYHNVVCKDTWIKPTCLRAGRQP